LCGELQQEQGSKRLAIEQRQDEQAMSAIKASASSKKREHSPIRRNELELRNCGRQERFAGRAEDHPSAFSLFSTAPMSVNLIWGLGEGGRR